jgi:hypothetical protein
MSNTKNRQDIKQIPNANQKRQQINPKPQKIQITKQIPNTKYRPTSNSKNNSLI